MKYCTDIFNSETAEKIVRDYRLILSHILDRPNDALSAFVNKSENVKIAPARINKKTLAISSSFTAEALLSTWINHNKFDVDSTSWLDLFHQLVIKNPQKTALFFETEIISYKALDEMANSFARELLNNCTEEDKFIGIFMNRTPAMVAAMIGVHKAGKAYLPLEPTFPILRLNYMITDSETGLIITDQIEKISNVIDCPQKLNFINSKEIMRDKEDYRAILKKEDCAYLLYTSGSTGTPKGVAINHGSFINLLLSIKNNPGCL